jgi:hypothetical protein
MRKVLVKLAKHPSKRGINHAGATVVLSQIAVVAKEPHLHKDLARNLMSLACNLLVVSGSGLVDGDRVPDVFNI